MIFIKIHIIWLYIVLENKKNDMFKKSETNFLLEFSQEYLRDKVLFSRIDINVKK